MRVQLVGEAAVKTTIIGRRHPKTGVIERPWRDSQGNFVLGDPKHGSKLLRRANAVLTDDYDEAVCLVQAGFSIRMSAGDGTPPSLISAAALDLSVVDVVPDGAVAPKVPMAPHTREDLIRDLCKALVAEAAMVAHWASDKAAEAFLGFPSSREAADPYADFDPEQLDLSRFRVTPLIEAAFDWAYQTGSPERFQANEWAQLRALLDGARRGVITNTSPMCDPKSALRVTIGTAFARWKLEFEPALPLNVGELAWLAQMREVAARHALAKAGIKGRRGVDNDTAVRWLHERQKFVPTREDLRLPQAP